MTAQQRLEFDILAKDRASSGFIAAGRSASDASDSVLRLAKRLDEVGSKSVKARVGLDGDKEAQAKLDALDLKMLKVGRRLIDPKVSLDGALKASGEISALDLELDKLAAKAEAAQVAVGANSETGLAGPSGMGALIGAGALLSPILITVGTGVAGFGAAAYGAISPITKAASATGGLRANMAKLDPEQRGLALSVLGLGQQYDSFQKALQPEVLSAFGKGIHLAGDLMHEVQPVAAATGKAIGGLLDEVDAEFTSGQWQNFFQFMAKTAGPDVKLLADLFTNLAGSLPGVAENLQPVATDLLTVADGMTTLLRLTSQWSVTTKKAGDTAGSTGGALGSMGRWVQRVTEDISTGGAPEVVKFWKGISGMGAAASGPGSQGLHDITAAAKPAVSQVTLLNNALTNLNNILSDQSAEVSWKQAQQAAAKAVEGGSKAVDGNSAKQLANRATVISSTQSLLTLVQQEQKTGKSVGSMAGQLQNQITFLDRAHDKSAFYRQELGLLERALLAVKSEHTMITVDGRGQYSVQAIAAASGHGGQNRLLGGARGMLITQGTTATADDVLIRASKGETIVSADTSRVLAPVFQAHGVPGYAAGGVVGSYGPGALPGLGSWIGSESAATLRAIESATAAATMHAIRAAQSSTAQTFAGGLGRASLRQIENWWMAAGGPGGGTAHVAAAITGPESGFNVRAVQQGQPYATTGWGLWQITPGNSEPQAGIDQQLLTGPSNARAAVAKYRGAGGFTPWATFVDGAYLKYMAAGGTAAPGWTVLGERGPELAHMLGGETVLSHSQSVQAAMGGALPHLAKGTLKAEESAGLSLANYYSSPGTAAGIRAEETRYLRDIAKYFEGSSAKWRDKAVERQTGRLLDVGNQIRTLGSRLAGARSYQQSVQSGLSGYADLSTTTLGGAVLGSKTISGAASLQGQLGQKLSTLKKFGQVIGKLSAAHVDAGLIRQVVALGESDPASGIAYGQEILSGGAKEIRALNKTESAIGNAELRVSRGAASSVYEGKYQPGSHFLQQLQHDKGGLEKLFRDLGKELGTEAVRWFRVPKGKRPKGFASGGVLTEPVYGYGASGQSYTFAENGPERIVPGGGSARGPLVVINGLVIREEADIGILAQKVSFAVTRAGLG